jgi:hydroxycarboxylate dehydrogenase B
LTGGGTAGPEKGEDRVCNGMLSIYLDPAHFGAKDLAEKAVEYADYVKSSPLAAGVEEVLVPGEPEARNRAQRTKHGVPLQVDTWTNLCNIAKECGVPIPA